MPDQEAIAYPESFVSPEEEEAARSQRVGDGTPDTAPEVLPPSTFADRFRRMLGIY